MKQISTFFLLFIGIYCSSQTLTVTIPNSLTLSNGTPFEIVLNPTNNGCTNQTISLNIGQLEYMPNSNSLPVNTSINLIPNSSSGNILSISGFSNGANNSTLLIKIGVQFRVGTCNGATSLTTIKSSLTSCGQTINATNTNVQANSTTDKSKIEIFQIDPSNTSPPTALCLNQIVKYRVDLSNQGLSGFNLSDVKPSALLPICAQVVGLFERGTYQPSISFVETSGVTLPPNVKKIEWNTNYLQLGEPNSATGQISYDLYVRYPCNQALTPNLNCSNGGNILKAYLTSQYCGQTFTAINTYTFTTTTQINNTCSSFNCTPSNGNGAIQVEAISTPKCISSCSNSLVSFYVKTPFSSYLTLPTAFEVNIPTGIILKSTYEYPTVCTTPTLIEYYDLNGVQLTFPNIENARKVKWIVNCGIRPDVRFGLYFKYDSLTFPNNQVPFLYKLFTNNAIYNLNGTFNAIIPLVCNQYLNNNNSVRKVNTTQSFSQSANGLPGETFTCKALIQNTGDSQTLINLFKQVLDPNLIYMGNFKYSIGCLYNCNGEILPDYASNFSSPNFGTITVSRPNVGSIGGEISLSSFNLACTPQNSIIYIWFDVKLKANLIEGQILRINQFVNSNIPNQFSAKITVSSLAKVTTKMLVKCPNTGNWSENTLNIKNNEIVNFRMRLVNEGSIPVNLSHIINQKPNIGDQFEIGYSSRNSSFLINYICNPAYPIKINTNQTSIPNVSFNYSLNPVNTDRSMICPPTGTSIPIWSSCNINSNWFKASFPLGFLLNPDDYIEIEYSAVVNGNATIASSAFNTFTFKANNPNQTDCFIDSVISNKLELINNEIGCIIQPCADFLWEIDGSFESCNSFASGTSHNGTLGGGWSNLMGSVDTRKSPFTSQVDLTTNTNIPLSQNGGVFAAAISKYFSSPNGYYESFKATINNLVVGASYRIEFEQINLSDFPLFQNNSVNWKVKFGGIIKESPELFSSSSPQWQRVNVNFIANATSQELIFEAFAPTQNGPLIVQPLNNQILYVGIDGIKILSNNTCPSCVDCSSFKLLKPVENQESKYLISGWVKEEDPLLPKKQYTNYISSHINVSFKNGINLVPGTVENRFYPSGEIIDGWQRIVGEFTVPSGVLVENIIIDLENDKNITVDGIRSLGANTKVAYFDDIRVLPSKGNMKSFVYDQKTQKLMAELDENNYSTFYEYDLEGGLIRIKKETEKGIFTIQETRSGTTKK